MPITPALLDQLLNDYQSPDAIFGNAGLLQHLTTAVVERARQGALTPHLGAARHAPAGPNSGTSRNGQAANTCTAKPGQLPPDVPRPRASAFAPQRIKKGPTRCDGCDDQIISR